MSFTGRGCEKAGVSLVDFMAETSGLPFFYCIFEWPLELNSKERNTGVYGSVVKVHTNISTICRRCSFVNGHFVRSVRVKVLLHPPIRIDTYLCAK